MKQFKSNKDSKLILEIEKQKRKIIECEVALEMRVGNIVWLEVSFFQNFKLSVYF